MSKTTKKFYLYSILFVILSIIMNICIRSVPGFANFYSHTFYRVISGIFSRLGGIFMFSLSEIMLYLLLLAFFVGFIHCIFQLLRHKNAGSFLHLISASLFTLSLLFFLYTINCGVNYHRDSFSYESGFTTRTYDSEELKKVCAIIIEEINTAEDELRSNQELSVFLNEDTNSNIPSWSYLINAGKEGQLAMKNLGSLYSGLNIYYPMPKALLCSRLLSIQQLTGIYSPITVEANYNREMPRYNIPFTICHELSHLAGYMQEEEANFIAFLACHDSDHAYFRYSAALSAFVYVGNALAKSDPSAYSEIYQSLPIHSQTVLNYEREFWNHFDSPISETADHVNDSYLKANGQSSGSKSYGQVVDLILSYYLDH